MGPDWIRDGKARKEVKTLWGGLDTPIQRWRHKASGKSCSTQLDTNLDQSGWTSAALGRLLDLAHRLPFEEACEVGAQFGLCISSSDLVRLFKPYGEVVEQQVEASLIKLADEPLSDIRSAKGRVIAVEFDGVLVGGRDEDGKSEDGCGIEIKTALVYPEQRPLERTRIAAVCEAKRFLPMISGLLRQAGVRLQDRLVAVTDGAPWIAGICETLGVDQHVLDVYHSGAYLDVVMEALKWTELQRKEMREAWCTGKWDARQWLDVHLLPEMNRTGWTKEAQNALRYLESRLHLMDYPTYRAKGYPIGSGQIEGMNKHVVGVRMKRAGQHWSRTGASRMAAVRAQHFSAHPLTTFSNLRHAAYPAPTPKS